MNNPQLFAVIVAISVVTFLMSCVMRFRLVTLGKPEDRLSHLGARIGNMLLFAFGQRRVVSRPFGLNHFVIFWSFLVLALANAEFVIHGIFSKVGLDLLPMPLHLALAGLFDVVSLITLVVILIAMGRRLFCPPKYIEALSRDAFTILTLIALLMVAFFGTHASMIAAGTEQGAQGMPISSAIASLIPAGAAAQLATVFWWAHAIILLAFLNYLPYSKHMHILTAIPNCFFRRLGKANTLPREEFKLGNAFGAGQLDRFTWKDLFDSYSCTECGRCQDVCPASNTGKPLNPRMVIHEMKVNLLANGAQMQHGVGPVLPLIGTKEEEGTVTEDAIWSCTSCGACMEVCPVFIEQMPKILQMRRHLVEMEAKFPEELSNLFENTEQRSNPWGIAPGERARWYANLDVKPFSEETEYLFFVGCAGAFDSRNKQVTLALASILDAAGVSWGVFGKDEKCCGDSLRRLGNEFVFDRMAKENVKYFQEKGVKKIITQCPHCFSTLKNDYRQFGLEVEVIHHSQLIQQLIATGKLKLDQQSEQGKVVFHDSCYLGRHNDVYAAPREALKAATGKVPAEMAKHHNNSFCCGAGGGRMWMEEHQGTRINLTRVKEALATDPNTICVSCPYCLTMFEDGLKDEKADDRVHVKDVAEVVAEGLREKMKV